MKSNPDQDVNPKKTMSKSELDELLEQEKSFDSNNEIMY